MTRMLASVATLDEVGHALGYGADFIDLKDPAQGALGAWAPGRIAAAVRLVAERRPVSATIGDLPMEPAVVAAAAARTADAGVDVVKIGFFKGGDPHACIDVLHGLAARGTRLVAVLFADRAPDLDLVPRLAATGFYGVMLDTADKHAGGLRQHLDDQALAGFAQRGKEHGLLSGLAGSLRLEDVAPLVALGPAYLGFRGALCRGAERTAGLDPGAFLAIRGALGARPSSESKSATATAGAAWPAQAAATGAMSR